MSVLNYGPSLEQVLNPSISRIDQAMGAIMQSMRVAVPAVVHSFYPGPPATIWALIATNEYVLSSPVGDVINLSRNATPLPLLTDVPVVILGSSGWSLTFPIKQGDECILMFMDTPLDVWFQNGVPNSAFSVNPANPGNAPINQRRHDLSDAVAIFGVRSTPHGLPNYSTTSTQLRSDDQSVMIDLAPSQITITAPTVTVNSTTANINASNTVNITGSSSVVIDGDSNTQIEGRVFLNHKHTGVTSGAGITGGVV